MSYSPSFPGLTLLTLSLCAVLTSCDAVPWGGDKCEVGVYICLYTVWRVDLVVRNTVIVYRQQPDRSSWEPNVKNCDNCEESTGFALPPWQQITLSSCVSLQESSVLPPLHQSLCLQLRSPCCKGATFKGPLSSRSALPAVCTGCHNVSALEEKEHEGSHVRNIDCPTQGLRPWFTVESVAGGDLQQTWGGGEISEVINT